MESTSKKVRRLIRTSSGSSTESASSKSASKKKLSLFGRKSSASKDQAQAQVTSPNSTSPSNGSGNIQTPVHASTVSARIPPSAVDSDSPVRGTSYSSFALFHANANAAAKPTPPPAATATARHSLGLFNSSGLFTREGSFGRDKANSLAGRENSNSGLFARDKTGLIGREANPWNTPQSSDATKRATAFPTKVFIPVVKPLQIVDDTAGSMSGSRTLKLPTTIGTAYEEELSLSNSSMAGASGGGGGSIKATENMIGPWKTVLQSNGLLPSSSSNLHSADKGVSANEDSVSRSQQDYDDDMKTIAGALLDDLAGATLTLTVTNSDNSETINGICKHFLRGKCRFREKCRNSHAIDNCVHCNAKLPKSRLAASAHLSKCYKSRHAGGVTSPGPTASTALHSSNARLPVDERSEAPVAAPISAMQDEPDGEVSLFEALRLH